MVVLVVILVVVAVVVVMVVAVLHTVKSKQNDVTQMNIFELNCIELFAYLNLWEFV